MNQSIHQVLNFWRPVGQVEALHLDQQFVDHADDAFTLRAGVHAAAGATDRVELLDVADRAALVAGGLAQGLEERADLLVRLAVVHRLELAGRHEEEWDTRFGGHRFGEVGLAGAGRPFEQHATPCVAAHLALERLRGEEQVHRVDRFALGLVGADDVIEAHVGVRRPQQRVGRAAGGEERDEDHRAEDQDQPERDDDLRVAHQPAGDAESDRVVVRESPQQVGEHDAEDHQPLAEPLLTRPLPVGVGIDVLARQHLAAAQSCHLHGDPLRSPCVGSLHRGSDPWCNDWSPNVARQHPAWSTDEGQGMVKTV